MFRATKALLLHNRTAFTVASVSRPLSVSKALIHRPTLLPAVFNTSRQIANNSNRSDQPPPRQHIDLEAEKKRAREQLRSRPSEVSAPSSGGPVGESSSSSGSREETTSSGLKHDIEIVKDTFSLSAVPREPRILGLAGTIPYLATSLSTVYLGWNLTKQPPTGNSFFDIILLNHDNAQHLLSVIEPMQLGYGAVIISFLGAIHWGLEFAEKKALHERTRFRYGLGLAAPLIAWPTLYMPIEFALTSQFMALTVLYFADARASQKGWAPAWYASYRFLLTAVVGVAILVSLVGRAKIGQHGQLTSQGLTEKLSQTGIVDKTTNWSKLEEEEKAKIKKEKKEAEEKEKEKKQKENESKDDDKQSKNKSKKGGDAEKKGTEKKDADEKEVDKEDADKKTNKDAGKEDTEEETEKPDAGEEKEGEKQDDDENDGRGEEKNNAGEKKDSGKKNDAKEDSDKDSDKDSEKKTGDKKENKKDGQGKE